MSSWTAPSSLLTLLPDVSSGALQTLLMMCAWSTLLLSLAFNLCLYFPSASLVFSSGLTGFMFVHVPVTSVCDW